MIMNENIDLYKILKDCPKGTKFYSPVAGDVYFENVIDKTVYCVEVKTNDINGMFFDRHGKIYSRYKHGECLLFPSKDQRDWSKWKYPKPKFDPNTLKSFNKVLVRTKCLAWHAAIFSHIDENTKLFRCSLSGWDKCIPYNDDTKHLVGTKDEAPEYYRYWED